MVNFKHKTNILFLTTLGIILLSSAYIYGEVITKLGETCIYALSLYSQQENVWSPNEDKILFVTNKDSIYFNLGVINSDGTGYQRLSEDTGHVSAGCWSKDGNKIYYQMYQSGYETLWSMNENGSQKIMILQVSPNYSIRQFMVSSDDSKIAYLLHNRERAESKLYVMNIDGTNTIELTNACLYLYGYFDWSPDSSKIVYGADNESSYSINMITIDNSTDTKLIDLNISPTATPKWQPGGNKILYINYTYTTDKNLFSINDDGTGETQLTSGPGYDFKWSPNGNKILFSVLNAVWVMNNDGSNKQKLITFDLGGLAYWSSDSTKIVYDDYQNLCVINEDGSNEIQITNNSLPFSNFSPVCNGDYQRIAYRSTYINKYISKEKIIVINSDGSNQQEILSTNDINGFNNLCWNPKTEQILYTIYSSEGIGQYELWSINSNGTNNIQLATESHEPVFSPDGTKIAYAFEGIWIMNVDGSNKEQLIESITSTHNADWSPQGDKIAYKYYSSQTRGNDIYIMNSNGTEQINLTNISDNTYNSNPVWSLEGDKIAYFVESSPDSSKTGLWVMDADGNNQKQLCYYTAFSSNPKWDENGRIYFIKGDPITQVFSIKSDGTDLRAETDGNQFINDFILSPQDNRIIYVACRNIFIKQEDNPFTPPSNDSSLIIGNNIFNPTQAEQSNIFIPSELNNVEVKIFTLSGNLVRDFDNVSTTTVSWDGKNEDGETVASGVYFVLLESDEVQKIEKIVVIK